MENRREFIKKVTAATVFGSMNLNLLAGSTDEINDIKLIVRADDIGNTYDVGHAIIKAHKNGIVTSASIMPGTPFFEEGVALCKATPTLTVGIHLTLLGSRIRPVLSPGYVPTLVDESGFFFETLQELENANPSVDELEREIRAQIGKVRGTGLNFCYLDYHRAAPENAREIILNICNEQRLIFGDDMTGLISGYKRLPLKIESWPNKILPDGQFVYYSAPPLSKEKEELFFDFFYKLEPGQWIFVFHPGYAPERASITELLCSEKIKDLIHKQNIQLVSYYDLWKEKYG